MPTKYQDELFADEMKGMAEEFTVKMSISTLDVAVDWMQKNLEPEDIFSEKQLSNWAEAAGWVKL